jgi:hypothetical protein
METDRASQPHCHNQRTVWRRTVHELFRAFDVTLLDATKLILRLLCCDTSAKRTYWIMQRCVFIRHEVIWLMLPVTTAGVTGDECLLYVRRFT